MLLCEFRASPVCDEGVLEKAALRAVVKGLLGPGVCRPAEGCIGNGIPSACRWPSLETALLRGVGLAPRGNRSQSRGVPFPSRDRFVEPPPVRGVALELPERAVAGAELFDRITSGGTLSI